MTAVRIESQRAGREPPAQEVTARFRGVFVPLFSVSSIHAQEWVQAREGAPRALPGDRRSVTSGYSTEAADVHVALVHVALVQVAEVQVALVQVAEVQVASANAELVQEALVQVADVQVALVQVADVHVADVQVASVLTCSFQASASKVGSPSSLPSTNARRFSFGFGGSVDAAARCGVDLADARRDGVGVGQAGALSIRAPFTWSGVQSGWRARSCAAAPATTGAANDVPDIHM